MIAIFIKLMLVLMTSGVKIVGIAAISSFFDKVMDILEQFVDRRLRHV
jgi:hypothetical protein